jgi:hypothetical protein
MDENTKVYCCGCGNYFGTGWEWMDEGRTKLIGICNAPGNMKGTYYSPVDQRINAPAELNKANDCAWFKERPKEPERKGWWRRLWT